MKKISIIILILAAVLAVVLLVFNIAINKQDDERRITVSLMRSNVPDYYRGSNYNYIYLTPTDEEIAVFRKVFDSYDHESGWPFNSKLRADLSLSVTKGRYEHFVYNSETGHLALESSFYKTVLRFEKYRPVFRKERDYYVESYTIVSGDDKDKLDAIVAKYRIGISVFSSIILERTLFDTESSEGESGIDLSRTFYLPDSKGRIPEIPEVVTEYLKQRYHWCSVDLVRTFDDYGYINDSVYILNIRVHWDETHDRIFVLEYDEESGALYSSEFEDIDPENGAKYSPFYDEIFICPKIRKEAESVFPAEQYSSYYGSVVLNYLPDDPSVTHIPAGMTYAEYAENCSDEDIEIRMNMYSESDDVEIDLDAVKEFMVKWHIDCIHVEDPDGNYFNLRRKGNRVNEDGSGQIIYN